MPTIRPAWTLRAVGAAFAASALLGLAGNDAPVRAGEAVTFGVMAPVTGPWAAEGQDMVNIVKLLAEKVNAVGGVNGRTLVVEVGDDAGDPRTAALAAQRLVARKVVAVVGTYGSSVTEASQGVYDEEGVAQIATGSTAVRLTEKKMPLFFRTCPRDDDQGRVLAAEVLKAGHRSIALLHDNTSYAKGLADETRAIFAKADGVKIVFFDAITPGDRDYNTTLVKMRAANPDVVVFTGYFPEAGMLLRQKKDMKWDVPMFGGDATNNAALVEVAGKEAAAGYHFVSPPGPADLASPEAVAFMDEYRARHGGIPRSVWAVLAGDAFQVLVQAARSLDAAPTGATLGKALHNGQFTGFTGAISFDAKGDRIGDVYRLYLVGPDGKFNLLESRD